MCNEHDEIDTYLPPSPTTVFDQYGVVMFPSKGFVLRIENKNTLVSIFFEKREVERILIVDGKFLNHIHNFVFLYKFKGINNDGATVACSLLDHPRAKLHDGYEQTERDFNKVHNKIAKLSNHKLVYYGARNEG